MNVVNWPDVKFEINVTTLTIVLQVIRVNRTVFHCTSDTSHFNDQHDFNETLQETLKACLGHCQRTLCSFF